MMALSLTLKVGSVVAVGPYKFTVTQRPSPSYYIVTMDGIEFSVTDDKWTKLNGEVSLQATYREEPSYQVRIRIEAPGLLIERLN